MNDEEYISRRAHLASQNVMTADNPPADDIQGLTEHYIEQCTSRLMEDLYHSPERIQEYFMEADYENSNLIEVFESISTCLWTDLAMENLTILIADIKTFLEEAVTNEAKTHVESL